MEETKKTLKRVCRCENCGNEAEMVVTCSLEDAELEPSSDEKSTSPAKDGEGKKVKGTATCQHCGNEADMWIDY